MLWPLSVVLVANELQNALMNNTNGRLAIPALAGLLVFSHRPSSCYCCYGNCAAGSKPIL